MSYDMNPYYNPENVGLTPVAQIEYSDLCYQFDTRVVWRHENGNLYTARDWGCSCPTPFEDYTSLEKLDLVNDQEYENLVREVREEWGRGHRVTVAEGHDFLRDVREAMNA